MLEATDSKCAPWHMVGIDDKRRGWFNCIPHASSLIPYKKVRRDKVKLAKRDMKDKYNAPLKGRRLARKILR